MVESLSVSLRDKNALGTRHSRRLRVEGIVPAVLYGRGEESISLTIPGDAFRAVLRHHGHVVSLTGGIEADALIKKVQWDTFGKHVMHVDLIRVKKGEAVQVTLELQTFGDPAGLSEGGTLEVIAHTLTIMCPPMSIPESLRLDVSSLHMGDSLTAGAVTLPEGASLVGDADAMVAHVVHPAAEPILPEDEAAAEAEPEVVGEADAEGDAESTDE